jgi:hypothetical protein
MKKHGILFMVSKKEKEGKKKSKKCSSNLIMSSLANEKCPL